MPHKIASIAFWITVVYWLGGLWGCAAPGDDQNYEMLDDDHDAIFETDPPGLQSRQEIAEALELAMVEPTPPTPPVPEDEPSQNQVMSHDAGPIMIATLEQPEQIEVRTDDEPSPSDDQEPTEQLVATMENPIHRAYQVATLMEETEPSLMTGNRGLDRSSWPKVNVGAGDGRTTHNPIFFKDLDLRKNRTMVVDRVSQDLEVGATYDEALLIQALEGERAYGLGGPINRADLIVQPIKFGLDLVFFPLNALFGPHGIFDKVTTPPTYSLAGDQQVPAAESSQ